MRRGLVWNYNEVKYLKGKEIQQQAMKIVRNGLADGIMILLSHPPVYTIGRGGGYENLKKNVDEIKKIAEIYEVERGGNITFHGPGQLVIYPILNLRKWPTDIGQLAYNLEEIIIKVLKDYNIIGERIPHSKYRGVWVEDKKICAMGLSIDHFITWHGLAFNVNTDLSYFENIVPCGIREYGVTSLEKLGIKEDIEEVKTKVIQKTEEIFDIKFTYDRSENDEECRMVESKYFPRKV
ncbi:lipoyl(octanoyl) transferase LipB [Petrotoga sp. DB-2]